MTPVQPKENKVPDEVQLKVLEFLTLYPSDTETLAEYLQLPETVVWHYLALMKEAQAIFLSPRLWMPTVLRVRPEDAVVRTKPKV